MRNTLSFIGWALVTLLAVDVLAFIAWVASGQVPTDGFYIGAITANVLKIIL